MKKSFSLLLSLAFIICLFLTGCGLFGSGGYSISVADADGNPVKGAMIQLCSDTQCFTEETDSEGVAFFDQKSDDYTVHVLQVPKGYFVDSDKEYEVDKDSKNLKIFLPAEAVTTSSASSSSGTGSASGSGSGSNFQSASSEAQPASPAATSDSTESALADYRLDNYTPNNSGHRLTFSTTDLDGNPIDDSIFADNKVTVINYFASWCPPCKEELPDFVEISDSFRGKGIGFMGVATMWSGDTVTEVQGTVNDFDIKYPVAVMNSELESILGSGIPQTLFVDSEGYILDITQEEAEMAITSYYEEQTRLYKSGAFDGEIEESDREMYDDFFLNEQWRSDVSSSAKECLYEGCWVSMLPKDALMTMLANRYLQ